MTDPFALLPRLELERRRTRLLSRIRRKYEIVEEPFAIGPLRFNFTRVKDADRVLDEVCAEEDTREHRSGERRQGNDLHLPYWAELWDSSIGVARWLVAATPASPLRGRARRGDAGVAATIRTLDLGCGMGLAGTVAAAMGNPVLLVDIEAPALLFARLNTLPYARRTQVRRLNWQTDRLDERFDLILGADVLYERAQWEYLEPFWKAHLTEAGTVVLGEPGRGTGDLFGEWITQRGWTLTQLEQPVATRAKPIRLFILNRGSQTESARIHRGFPEAK